MGDVHNVQGGGEPHDPLTRMADSGIQAVLGHPEASGAELVIVIVRDGAQQGIAAAGLGDGQDGMQQAINVLIANAEALGITSGNPVHVLRFSAS